MPGTDTIDAVAPWLPSNLIGAWGAVKADPVGILLPAGGMLLLQATAAMAVQWAWRTGGIEALAAAVVAAVVARTVLGAPLRALMLAAGARAMGMTAHPMRRWPSLLGVQLVVGPLQLAAGSACVASGVVGGGLLAGQGWLTTAAFVVFLGMLCGTLAALTVRAVFAYAPVEVMVRGRSAMGALGAAIVPQPRELLPALTLLGLGDLLVGVGALACGAGALPGYPLSDLALIHRWRHSPGGRP